MLVTKKYKLIELTLYLMMIGFVFSVSWNGKLELNKLGVAIRFSSLFLQFYLIMKRVNLQKLMLLNLLFILCLIYLDKQWIYFLQIFFVCNLLKGYKNKYIIKMFKKISLFNLILVFMNYYLGFSSQRLMYGFVGNIIYKRETYGLVHPNILSFLFLSFITMDYLEKRKIVRTIACLICIYFLTKTRSIVGLFGLLYIFLKLSEIHKLRYIIFMMSKYISLIMLVLLILSKRILCKDDFFYFNKLLSNRLELWQFNFANMNTKDFLFGNSYLVKIMDNSYLMLHNYGGILLFLFYFYIHLKSLNKLKEENKIQEIIFILSFSILFNFESILLVPGYMFTIYYWVILYKYNYSFRIQNKKNSNIFYR